MLNINQSIIERNKEIEIAIRKRGYSNKLIEYIEFQDLYRPYINEMSEKDFGEILGITERVYFHLKNDGAKVKILKVCDLTEERKEEIRQELICKGNMNQSIDYKQFQTLYEPYKGEFGEKDFAIVLKISYCAYREIKYKNGRAVVLKTLEVTEERKEEIREELRKIGYRNKLINYDEFQNLYELYKYEMKEYDFAEILGIKYSNYTDLRTGIKKVKVLKGKVTKELKREIINSLKELGYEEKAIDYTEFQKLYEQWKNQITEKEFSNIIRISETDYYNIKKRKNGKTIMLKPARVTDERKEEIIYELRKKGYSNKKIEYDEFKLLYEQYSSEMSENDLRDILEISECNFRNMKNKGAKVIILKYEDINIQRKKEIKEELRSHQNELIGYTEFKVLYKPYQVEINEEDFANLIGICGSRYSNMKSNSKTKTRVLPPKTVSSERRDEIRNEMRQYGDTEIDYNDFNKLYQQYKREMSEKDFAAILDISKNAYVNMKNKQGKVMVLKHKQISAKRIKEIIEELNKYSGQEIGYNEFQDIYSAYKKEINEKDFAYILGISYSHYMNMKHNNSQAKINYKKIELERIKYQLTREKRYYKIEELGDLSNKYDVDIENILIYIYGNKRYMDVLKNRGSIYIGNCEIPKAFREKHARDILEMAKIGSKMLTNKYRIKSWNEDLASETLMYTLKNKGEFVENIEDEEQAMEAIKSYMYVYMDYRCLNKLKIRKSISLDDAISRDSTVYKHITERYEKVGDKSINVEDEVANRMVEKNDTNQIVIRMKDCYDKGMNNAQAIKFMTEECGISKEELLRVLKEELEKKRKVMKTATNEVYLGEEVE